MIRHWLRRLLRVEQMEERVTAALEGLDRRLATLEGHPPPGSWYTADDPVKKADAGRAAMESHQPKSGLALGPAGDPWEAYRRGPGDTPPPTELYEEDRSALLKDVPYL